MIREKHELIDGGRRFQREGPATEKDLDFAIVVLVRGTKSSRLSRERRGRRDEAEVGSRMASQRYLGATLIWALRTIRRTFVFNASRDLKPMEMCMQCDSQRRKLNNQSKELIGSSSLPSSLSVPDVSHSVTSCIRIY